MTSLLIIAIFVHLFNHWLDKKKNDKRRKSLSLFSINSPSNPDIPRKYKEPHLTVDDYVHIPDRGLSNFIESELKGEFLKKKLIFLIFERFCQK